MTLQPRLIVGLGNPGPEYANTRHNVGFMAIDAILVANRRQVEGQHLANSTIWSIRTAGRPLFLQKPLTYMNCSGEAVALFCRRRRITPSEMLVIYDDLDLPLGRMRIRLSGSAGGQRGLQSIIDCLGTEKVPRLRIGIGPATEDAAKFVLSAFTDDERAIVDKVIATGREAVGTAVRRGLQQAMNQFNGTNYQKTELPEEPNP